MDLGLTGKVALVAGASSGLGLAIARELAAEGARVSIAARTPEKLASALEQLPGEGHLSRALDVADAAAVQGWVDDTVAECGALHIVVANAGGPPAGRATAFAVEDYRRALETNMLSQIGMVQMALPHLQAAGWGRILFITGRSVKTPQLNLALSNTARVGVVAYAKSLVADLGAQNITVNVLAPGSHDTPRLRQLSGGKPPSAGDIPLGRVGQPEEFAAAATFLASERAGYITGVVLQIDGGAVDSLL
jgi:3-oxoacyl-[acyl-carrier protein] reductase